ncbi:hypothetical protein TNCT_655601 [Trichonephila clavata]|uniref:Uncharacterized protein n=1 Tax=Trichonephila clavata TaxID=2740835 RepID=A0A8X6LAD0_TRICU|nr:hypothetical protein TNCT_655601 [Trichonephila clavata]
MFIPTRHDISRAVEGFLTVRWTHRPCVLMHAGWFYRNPYARYMQRGSVTFVPTRHGIHRAMKGFRTEPWTH